MDDGFIRFFQQIVWDESPSARDSKTEALTPYNLSFGRVHAFRCRKREVALVEYGQVFPGPSIDAFL